MTGRSGPFVVISGCSGAGKSTLLAELSRRGYAVCPEAGRAVVRAQMRAAGDAVPWRNLGRFLELTLRRSLAQRRGAKAEAAGPVFFDRATIDILAAFRRADLAVPDQLQAEADQLRYHDTVIFAPPWPEIFRQDAERRHSFAEARAEYEDLARAWPAAGYRLLELPFDRPDARADFVIGSLAL